MHSPETGRDRERESESTPKGMTSPQCLLFQSPLGILGTHAYDFQATGAETQMAKSAMCDPTP